MKFAPTKFGICHFPLANGQTCLKLPAVNRLWNILIALLLLAAIGGELHCLAEDDSDHCSDSQQCLICAATVIAEPVAAVFEFFPAPVATLPAISCQPTTPHLALLTPPPKSEI
jgi:hypothetical protein